MNGERFEQTWPLIRDLLLFIGGMAGLLHETLIATGERPTLIAAFLAMSGLPAFFRADTRRNKQNGNSKS